ncbi:NUDIX domain-containing protein [Pedobacter sp.]|uniref:NUDIX domain-containing protein n=1 Tax=Pedobacter sp. TaxID=1411316 RepID=UPI003D7F8B32
MGKTSAGILLYKKEDNQYYFFLVHPGGPYFKNKNDGWWTIPKGEPEENEAPLATALRELKEETGYEASGSLLPLSPIIQKGGKKVECWAVEGNLDPDGITTNTFQIEWPPKSGQLKAFAEIDRAGWFTLDEANQKINTQQRAFLEELLTILKV